MTTLRRLYTTSTISVLAIAIGIGTSSAANAQADPNMARLTAAVERLEARVAALEGENKQAKREAASARAELRAFRNKGGTAAPAVAAAAVPPGTYAMATKAPILPPAPGWSGLYAGAAFGVGLMRARDDRTGNASSTVTLGPPAGPPTQTQITTETFTADAPFGERSAGGIVNLYLGYNFLATPTIVLGAQVEGGVANIRAKTGPVTRMFNQNTSTSFDTNAVIDEFGNRWTASVLGRAGVLVDPQDLLYLIGGYTYARSDEFSQPAFNLDGATVGAGWERQIASGWSLRGEYRYTTLRSRDVTETVTNSSAVGFRNNAGVVTQVQAETDVRTGTTHVSADMHSLWLGVAHYFGQ